MIPPGIHENLDARQYHADPAASASRLKIADRFQAYAESIARRVEEAGDRFTACPVAQDLLSSGDIRAYLSDPDNRLHLAASVCRVGIGGDPVTELLLDLAAEATAEMNNPSAA